MKFLPTDGHRLVVIAYEGWNDAGEAAVDTAHHLIEQWQLGLAEVHRCEEYFDMTFIRPVVKRTGHGPVVEWPRLQRWEGTIPGTDVAAEVWVGVEPSYRWTAFVDIIRDRLTADDRVVLLGALLADVVHTRPLPVSATAETAELSERFAVDVAEYEGPVGIVGVAAALLLEKHIPAVSLWVAVPGYAAGGPSPKAILALLGAFEETTGLVVPQHDLVEESRAWELGTDQLVESDPDLAEHVARIEGMTDASELPEASGDAIAREFEKYLSRRRGDADR